MKLADGAHTKLNVRSIFVVLALFTTAIAIGAEDKEKKTEKKPEPPRVTVAIPPAVSAGGTNLVRVRGSNLTNVTELHFTNTAFRPVLTIKSRSKADLPKDADAKKLGDTQVEVELALPANTLPATNYFVVHSPDGTSEARPLIALPQGSLVAEREPNGSFRQAQPLRVNQSLSGLIKEPNDVDVFRFSGKRGQRVQLEICAAAIGSALDSTVSLLDHAGHAIATNDDTRDNGDSMLEATLPADGDYLISVIDAHEKGGPTHVYLLSIR